MEAGSGSYSGRYLAINPPNPPPKISAHSSGFFAKATAAQRKLKTEASAVAVHYEITVCKAFDQRFDTSTGFLTAEPMFASLACRTSINQRNLSRDAIDLMRPRFPPIQIVPDEILREENIVIHQ